MPICCIMYCRYDVELFQKIEALTGQKMELYPTEQVCRLLLQFDVFKLQSQELEHDDLPCLLMGPTNGQLYPTEQVCRCSMKSGMFQMQRIEP